MEKVFLTKSQFKELVENGPVVWKHIPQKPNDDTDVTLRGKRCIEFMGLLFIEDLNKE